VQANEILHSVSFWPAFETLTQQPNSICRSKCEHCCLLPKCEAVVEKTAAVGVETCCSIAASRQQHVS